MVYFSCDYAQGCHPEILKALEKTNMVSTAGYGEDEYCLKAKELIKKEIECPEAEIYFLVGGTQTNQFVIDTTLANFHAVIAANSGHVSVHEGGAIEYTGHKVLELPSVEGKIQAETLKNYLFNLSEDENHEHMACPGMVYISYPTEYGTLYSKKELEDIYNICKDYDLPLYIDGARLGYGLAASSDMTMADIAKLCDIFYIGGTKQGLMFGEAVVYTHKNTPKHMVTQLKQHGALLAKGRLLGVQFEAAFTNNLYSRISADAIRYADIIKNELKDRGYRFFINSPTNQIFIILDNRKMKELSKKISFGFWEKYDEEHTVIRIATSWTTTEQDVKELLKEL